MIITSLVYLPCEQKFPSCMAFSVYEVVRVACQSRRCLVFIRPWGVQDKPTTRLTSNAKNFVTLKAMQDRKLCSTRRAWQSTTWPGLISGSFRIGKITTQQVRTNQVIEVKCFLLKIPAIIFLNLWSHFPSKSFMFTAIWGLITQSMVSFLLQVVSPNSCPLTSLVIFLMC